MRRWLAGLESRELHALILGAIAVLALLIYQFAWHPFSAELGQLRGRVAEQRETAAWMRDAAARLEGGRGSAEGAIEGKSGQSLLSLVDSTAKAARLAQAVKRIEPDGDDGARVWLEKAAFDDLIRWLTSLRQGHGMRVDTINIDKTETPGTVDVRLVLARG